MLYFVMTNEAYAWIWGAVMIFALVIEFLTVDLVSVWFFCGGLASLILALCGVDPSIQLIVFASVSFVFMLVSRPFLKKYLKRNEIKTNVDTLQGRIAVALSDIIVGERGTVKIDGIEWSAVSNEDIKEGSKVEILSIEGNKLIVKLHKTNENNNIHFE